MSTMIDPGTPEARRAWLDSLPVGSVVVDAWEQVHKRYHSGWWIVDDITGNLMLDDGAVSDWCREDFWPGELTLPHQMMHHVAANIVAWQVATFGAPADPLVTLAKLRDEVDELHAELRQVPMPGVEDAHAARVREEAADVAFLLLDLMRGFGGPDALAAAMAAKLDKNRARTWVQGADGKWSGSK